MNTDLTQRQKQHAHGMIERLAPEQLSAVVGLLEVLLNPLDRALATAEIDDEPVTDEERRDIEASREWFKHNKGIPFEQVVADLGFTMEEVQNFRGPFVKELVFADRAKHDLASLDPTTRLRVIAGIQRLAFHSVGDIKKLQGVDPPEYRLRVGDWRVRFSRPDADTVRINRVQNRRDAYR